MFRFKEETEQAFNAAIYGKAEIDRSMILRSTIQMNGRQNHDENVIIVNAPEETNTIASESAHDSKDSKCSNILSLFIIATALTLANEALVRGHGAPGAKSLPMRTKFFANSEILGVLFGLLAYSVIGFKKAMCLSLVIIIAASTGMIYLEERN